MTEARQHSGQAHSGARNRRLMQATMPTHVATGPAVSHMARKGQLRNERSSWSLAWSQGRVGNHSRRTVHTGSAQPQGNVSMQRYLGNRLVGRDVSAKSDIAATWASPFSADQLPSCHA
jgi:hypothetical protein